MKVVPVVVEIEVSLPNVGSNDPPVVGASEFRVVDSSEPPGAETGAR